MAGQYELGKKYQVFGDESIYDGEVGALLYFRSTTQPGVIHKLFPQDTADNVSELAAPKTSTKSTAK